MITIEFDETKNQVNIAKHGVALTDANRLVWETAATQRDERGDYKETRFITYAMIDARLHCFVWTARAGKIRAISLRTCLESFLTPIFDNFGCKTRYDS